MKNLDLNLLPIALALYNELNVSRAARQLGMSQPAVSKALRRLRETFDDPLFIRGPSGIVPTPRAHGIVRAARHLHNVHEELVKDERFDPATSTRPIVLGLSDIAEMAFLSSILEHLRLHAPKCPVRTVSVPDDDMAGRLETGDVDVAARHAGAGSGKFPVVDQGRK
jgi:DNA-binding transcriptional LysR family regulator